MFECFKHILQKSVWKARVSVLTSLHARNNRKKVVDGSIRVSARAEVVAPVPTFVAVFGFRCQDKRFRIPGGEELDLEVSRMTMEHLGSA